MKYIKFTGKTKNRAGRDGLHNVQRIFVNACKVMKQNGLIKNASFSVDGDSAFSGEVVSLELSQHEVRMTVFASWDAAGRPGGKLTVGVKINNPQSGKMIPTKYTRVVSLTKKGERFYKGSSQGRFFPIGQFEFYEKFKDPKYQYYREKGGLYMRIN